MSRVVKTAMSTMDEEDLEALEECSPTQRRLALALSYAAVEDGLDLDLLGDTDDFDGFMRVCIQGTVESAKENRLSATGTMKMLFAQAVSVGYSLALIDLEEKEK